MKKFKKKRLRIIPEIAKSLQGILYYTIGISNCNFEVVVTFFAIIWFNNKKPIFQYVRRVNELLLHNSDIEP